MSRRLLGAAAAIGLASALGGTGAGAVTCPSVFLPEGYGSTCSAPTGDEAWRLDVVAEDAPLGERAKLTIRPVDGPIEDPFSWLQEQVVVDLASFRAFVSDLLEHPDNPLSGVIAPELFDSWLEQFGLLGQLPLRGCAYPAELAGDDVWQMDCRWAVGPIEQLVRLQLVDPAHDPYLITIWTANERRQRHLQAIANSLEWRT